MITGEIFFGNRCVSSFLGWAISEDTICGVQNAERLNPSMSCRCGGGSQSSCKKHQDLLGPPGKRLLHLIFLPRFRGRCSQWLAVYRGVGSFFWGGLFPPWTESFGERPRGVQGTQGFHEALAEDTATSDQG